MLGASRSPGSMFRVELLGATMKLRSQSVLAVSGAIALGLSGVVTAPMAEAAECQSFGSYGGKVCGTWNGETRSYSSVRYASTSSWKWEVSKSDTRMRINWVDVETIGRSNCSFQGAAGFCDSFGSIGSKTRVRIPRSGKSWTKPSYRYKWGAVTGKYQYQFARFKVSYTLNGKTRYMTGEWVGQGRLYG